MAADTPAVPAEAGGTDRVSLVIDAPPEAVYDLVSDITRMGQWSPECVRCTWLGGASGAAVGARFRGWNRRGPALWFTTSRVVEAERGKVFSFEVKQSGARWTYRFEPHDGGTLVTEERTFWRDRPTVAAVFTRLFLGGAGHEDELREGMRQTLERVKSAAESG